MPGNVLIVTATKVETQAVLAVFREATGQDSPVQPIHDRIYYDLGTVNDARVFMLESEMGSEGLGGSQESVTKGIHAVSPSACIMVGIAFGIDAGRQSLGDVLVSRQLLLYECQRVGTDAQAMPRIVPRGDKPHASTWLLNRFKAVDSLRKDEPETRVHFGLMLSGDKLVDNINFRDQLRALGPEAIGGEMEGAGLYAACQDKNVHWIVVKGICDWADGCKALNKEENQSLAADNAARFVLRMLQLAPLKGLDAPTLTQQQIPQADPKRFSIMVTHLEHDENRYHERLILEALKEYKGIQVLAFDRTICLEGPVPEAVEARGRESALTFLDQSGASVLIWGTVLGHGDNTVPKLYWTDCRGGHRKRKRYHAPLIEEQLRLPAVFWSDLSEVLRLLISSHHSDFAGKQGHYVADQLPDLISRVQTLLEASGDRPGWDTTARGSTRVILADALYVFGDQGEDNEALEASVATLRQALTELTRERVPFQWATIQYNLGTVLSVLGERDSSTARFEEAVVSFREALKVLTRERAPLDWAAVQDNLGSALRAWGQREAGTARLEEAIVAFRMALEEHNRDRLPMRWASTQNNLGTALEVLGERSNGTAFFEQAVVAYQEALEEYARGNVPLERATTQHNLGNALRALGERKNDTALLRKAVESFHEALKERTRHRMPLAWAETQNSLGVALRALGERESGSSFLLQAIGAFREALNEWTRERVPLDWAMTQNNLGTALAVLGKREQGTARLEEAVAAFENALEVLEAADATYYEEAVRTNLKRVETLLQDRRN